MEIGPINQLASISEVSQVSSAPTATGGFGEMLQQLAQEVNTDQMRADQGVLDLAQGKTEDLQAVVMSVARADLSFRFFLEMRNKLTESYQELSRMQF